MLLEIRVVHALDPEALAVFHAIHTEIADMNDHLKASVDALVAAAAASDAKLDTVIQGLPGLIGAAVTKALADASVADDAAAALVDQAVADVSSHVAALVAAATPAPAAPPPPPPEPNPADVVATGDAHAAPSGADTVDAPAGDAPVEGDPPADAGV